MTAQRLAPAAYGAGEFEAAVTAWEEAYAACRAAGDDDGAAAAAATVASYLLIDTGLMAPVRGWLGRAERLLAGREESATAALVAMARAYERLLCGEAPAAASWAAAAVELGDRHGAPLPATLGRICAARTVILDGEVDRGLALLDEAAVAVLAGELDPIGAGMAYCELICAMQGLGQHDRAEQWTAAMERWRGEAVGGFAGRCRVHRAELLRLRGSCAEAEREALAACGELRPWLRREFGWPLTELGQIRLRLGDLAGAEEALVEAHQHGWEPQPALALLRLAQGEADTAAAMVADALERPSPVPSKERPPSGALRRAPLLAAQAEIAAARDDAGTARRAAEELTAIAATYRSAALAAAASLARGRAALLADDAGSAVRECEQAAAGWSEVGAPYEVAEARLVLARAYVALGRPDRAELEQRAADAALRRIGRAASPAGRPTVSWVFRRDGDTRTVTFAGRTVLLQDLKGLRYLAVLLAEPDREFHVLDLLARESGLPRPPSGDLGPVLDAQAREAYRRRLAEIDEDIAEAAAIGDQQRVALAAADRDYLVRELAGAFGIGGRSRELGSASERARGSVSRALRYALARIAEHHRPLADHLGRTLHTGTFCSYRPDPQSGIRWIC